MDAVNASRLLHAAIKPALGKPCVNTRMELRPTRLAPADWDAALAPGGLPLQQSAAYGAVAEAAGRRVLRLELWHGARILGHAQILRRGPVALLSRGPVWVGTPDPATRRAALRALGAAQPFLIVTPEAEEGAGLPLVTPRHVAEIDLTVGPTALRAAMAGKWRNRLVVAESAGLSLRPGGPRDLDDLIAREVAQRRARGYRALPPEFTRAVAALGPGAVRLWCARRKGETLAAMAFLLHRPWATYHLGWSGPEGRSVHAHALLLWTAMQAFAAEGMTRLDLGDVNTEDAAGLARFKIGSGARVRALGATVLLPPVRLRR